MAKNKRTTTKGLDRQLQQQGNDFKPTIGNTRPNATMKTTTPRSRKSREGFADDYDKLGNIDLDSTTEQRGYKPFANLKK